MKEQALIGARGLVSPSLCIPVLQSVSCYRGAAVMPFSRRVWGGFCGGGWVGGVDGGPPTRQIERCGVIYDVDSDIWRFFGGLNGVHDG